MKIATTTADLITYSRDKSIGASVDGLVRAGFKHIDMSFYHVIYPGSPWISSGDGWKAEVDAAAEKAARFGIDYVQSHAPDGEHFVPGESRDALLLATERTVKACAMLGIKNTVIHGKNINGLPKEEVYKQNALFYGLFAEMSEKYGVEMLAENSSDLWNPGYPGNTAEGLLEFLQAADIPNLYICWDTGHANCQGLNQYDELVKLGGRLKALHLQDNCGNADSHTMPMAGTTNYDQIMRALCEIDYRGCFTFEGSNTIRPPYAWPHMRRDLLDSDRLANVPVNIAEKQLSVMLDIGRWMLESYGITEE